VVTGYPVHKMRQVDARIDETWAYLSRNGLTMPAPEENGRAGYLVLTEAGQEAAASSDAFERFRAAKGNFPRLRFIRASRIRSGLR
jgi:hypothetical protein